MTSWTLTIKEGSWNPRVSAHTRGHNLANIGTLPYSHLCEELPHIFPLLTPLELKIRMSDGQIPPDFLTCPYILLPSKIICCSQCHTNRKICRPLPAKHSFPMTTRKILRHDFPWHSAEFLTCWPFNQSKYAWALEHFLCPIILSPFSIKDDNNILRHDFPCHSAEFLTCWPFNQSKYAWALQHFPCPIILSRFFHKSWTSVHASADSLLYICW